MIISIINNTLMTKEEVQRVLRAVNRQMREDFKKYWHRDVELRLEGWTGNQLDPEDPIDMRGDAVLYLWDEHAPEDPLGYHDLNAAGIPFGFVFTQLSEELGEPWSVTLSHEVLEMAMDLEVNLLAEGPHPDPAEGGRAVLHWYELCDAVQTQIYDIDGVAVSNFLLPHYFTYYDEHVNHNDFLGSGIASFGVANGGYVGFFDPELGEHQTWFAAADSKAECRMAAKRKYQGLQRTSRHNPGSGAGVELIRNKTLVHCDAVMFELTEASGQGLDYAIRLVGDRLGEDWRVQSARPDSLDFDAIYQGKGSLGFAEAWDCAHELNADAAVAYAEPSLSYPIIGESDRGIGEKSNARRASTSGNEQPLPGTEDSLWALKLCRVDQAWEIIANDAGRGRPGEGVRIGHPDSGYRPHEEMDASRVLANIDYDFIGNDRQTINLEGNHGLSTASVIMSGRNAPDDKIRGPAMFAEIVPLRVAKPAFFIPTPVLLSVGMRRLRDAIDYAISIDCGVISISLGGLHSAMVKKAVKRATDAGLIVLAAAGNEVGFVVAPAKYKQVIAVAGCNIKSKPWRGSSHGDTVDITAPGESVWRARYNDEGEPDVGRGDGTSYAVALTAGVAAMWLGYHGRDALIGQYGKKHLYKAFRYLVWQTANQAHALPAGEYGAGLLDAAALLNAALPSLDDIRQQATPEPRRAADIARDLGIDAGRLDKALETELEMAETLEAFTATRIGRKAAGKSRTRGRQWVRGLSKRLASVV